MFGKLKKTLDWIIWKTLPNCKDVTALISRSMESDLSLREKIVLKTHLWSCIACNRYFLQVKFMSEAVKLREKRFEQGEETSALSSDAVKRIKDTLKSSKCLVLIFLLNFINPQ